MASKLERKERELTAKVVAIIERGSPRSTAAAAAGIRLGTLNDWLHKAAQGQQPYKRFAKALDEAEAGVESSMAETLLDAGGKDWRAAEAFLKARFPERWARQDPAAVKDMTRLIAVMREQLPTADFLRVLRVWDYRSTIED